MSTLTSMIVTEDSPSVPGPQFAARASSRSSAFPRSLYSSWRLGHSEFGSGYAVPSPWPVGPPRALLLRGLSRLRHVRRFQVVQFLLRAGQLALHHRELRLGLCGLVLRAVALLLEGSEGVLDELGVRSKGSPGLGQPDSQPRTPEAGRSQYSDYCLTHLVSPR